jgi:HPt (histidine-containing phosphotransfer) domain-containing protein
MTGVMEMLLAQGFDDYLSKPIDTEKLHQALKKWIKPGLRKTINDDREKGGQDSDLLLALGKVGINTEVCLKNCGEKEDGCRLTLRAFLKDAEHFYWRLTQSAASLDLKDLAISAHAIKSAAANIGALKLSDVAKELEASFKANQTQAVSDGLFGAFLQSLCDLADRLRTVLDAGMAEGSGDSQFRGHFKSVEIGSDIEKLREALKANDVNSADRLVEELGKKADEKLKAILDEVSYQILVSDYQAALKLIANL